MGFVTTGTYKYGRNWCIIECDEEITRYYRHLYYLYTYKTIKLNRPRDPSHISVVTIYDKKPPEYYDFKYQGEKVDIAYDLDFHSCDTYVWMTVSCPHALSLREELGLGQPHYPFHLTIGNLK